ncbi:PREDICTED: subtilisin-like protease SBT5.4 [Lupinus angustifolius]|uniref:subtilisin-like protease SBT5.4 n=1 Tax=Lupinus angustifolius TaxID=3871 RepID=UPI00092F76AE|nr:PREDICTED: subtilisin-like protease SBT5.4 [Lupinus angustifolius]
MKNGTIPNSTPKASISHDQPILIVACWLSQPISLTASLTLNTSGGFIWINVLYKGLKCSNSFLTNKGAAEHAGTSLRQRIQDEYHEVVKRRVIKRCRGSLCSVEGHRFRLRLAPYSPKGSYLCSEVAYKVKALLVNLFQYQRDISAPGVDIIAAYSEGAPPGPHDKRRTPFMTMSGTSMATPHVAGLAGLLKEIHPDWSPAAIKSAIMTTAGIKYNIGEPVLDEWLFARATPLAYSTGVIQPNHATNLGLVYNLRTTDYLNFLCGRHYNSSMIQLFYGKSYTCPKSFQVTNINYPSISITPLVHGHSQHVTRTLTNNVGSPGKYRVHINAPPEVVVSVKPKILRFKHKGEKRKFRVTFKLKTLKKSNNDYFYGSLVWTDHKHIVRSPIVIKNPIL